ncbi:hypothetical protein V8E54_012191 [Elaphomyces granulatus]
MVDCGESYSVSNGSALPWILEHYLAYPGSYEIPLRTMYTLNSAPTSLLAQPSSTSVYQESAFAREKVNTPSSPAGSTCSQSEKDFPFVYDTAAQFRAQLISQIPRLPSQHCSLPPSFVTSFLRRCFAPQLEEVDFPQALTALDYLKDLETRRRKEVAAALARLGIDRADMSQKQEMGQRYPGVLRWIESLEAKERRVEALYTQVYVGLRRWTMINEMMLEPYNKANCLAMLNTLLPPVTPATVQPTAHLTPKILQCQRDGFWRYIISIETNGKQILDKVMKQGAREGEETAWPLARDALDKYLRSANEIIGDCLEINDPESLADESSDGVHKSRKVDSGISFNSERSETPSGSSNSSGILNKDIFTTPKTKKGKAGSTTLERIAKELRKMRGGRDHKEKNRDSEGSNRILPKRLKSTSALNEGYRCTSGSSSSDCSHFEIDEFNRKRLIWEATNKKSTQSSRSSYGSQ